MSSVSLTYFLYTVMSRDSSVGIVTELPTLDS